MSKTIRESLGPVHEQNAATVIDEATPQFEVKYSSSKRGPIKVTKFMTQDQAQTFLKKIRGEGMNGIISKGGKPVRTPMKEDAKSERLAKIARAAAAREKDQAKQKEEAKKKHYAASAKSRESVKHFGNKDQFGRVREDVEQVDESLGNFMADYDGKEMKVRAKDEEDARSRVGRRLKIPKSKQHKIVVWEPMTDAERRDFELDDDGEREYANRYGHDMARKADRLKQRAKKRAGRRKQRNEEVEQVDEISVKKKAQAYRKMRDRQADVSYNPHTGKSDMLADTPEKKRANRMLKRIGDKHGKDVKRSVYKSQYEDIEQVDEAAPKASAKMMANTQSQKKLRARIEKNKRTENEIESRKQLRNRIIKKKTNEDVEQVDEGRRRGMIDDEGYRRDSRGREYNPVDDRIRARNAARHRAEAEAKRKKAEAERKKKEKTNESVGITEDDKAEYNKLMDKYGDMPMSKVPMKARLRIRELGRSVRGDKGGPTAGDLVKNMKRRRMGEEVEQVDEGERTASVSRNAARTAKTIMRQKHDLDDDGKPVPNYGAPGNKPYTKSMKDRAKDVKDTQRADRRSAVRDDDAMNAKKGHGTIRRAVSRTANSLKIRNAQRKANKAVNLRKHMRSEEVEQVDESEYGSIGDRVKRKLRKPGGLADRHDNRVARKSSSPEKRDGAVQRMADRRGKRGPMDHDSSKWHSDEKLRSKVRKSAGVNEEVEQVDEVKYGGLLHKVRKGGKPGGIRDLIDRGGRNNVISISDKPKRMTKAQIGRRQRIADRRPSLKGTGPIDDPENYPSNTGFGKTFKKHPNSGAAKLKRALDREDAAVRKRKERPPVKRGGLADKILKGGKPGSLRDKIDQGHRLRSPETNRGPTGKYAMSKSDIRRAQRMVDRRPSLKGTGPIDDPDNYALKTGGVDMAGIYYDKDDKSGSAKLARQLRKERSRKQRNEEVEVAEGGMIGRTKPSRELNVQKDEKPHLAGVKSLKYQKRAAHKAERKKAKQDIKKDEG